MIEMHILFFVPVAPIVLFKWQSFNLVGGASIAGLGRETKVSLQHNSSLGAAKDATEWDEINIYIIKGCLACEQLVGM